MQRDLIFLSGDFTYLPKEKKYLTKYFKTKIQRAFLSYFLLFGDYENFVDHTGLYCQMRYLKILHFRLLKIELAHKNAKRDVDLTSLALIESGKLRKIRLDLANNPTT